MSIPTMNELIEVAQESKFYDVATWDKDFFNSPTKRRLLDPGAALAERENRYHQRDLDVTDMLKNTDMLTAEIARLNNCAVSTVHKIQNKYGIVRKIFEEKKRRVDECREIEVSLFLRYCDMRMDEIRDIISCGCEIITTKRREMIENGVPIKFKRGKR